MQTKEKILARDCVCITLKTGDGEEALYTHISDDGGGRIGWDIQEFDREDREVNQVDRTFKPDGSFEDSTHRVEC